MSFSACSQFKEISFAYEVLSDAEKRQVYDRHGEERLKEGGGGGPGFGSAEDLFSSIFGGGFFGTRTASTLHQKAFCLNNCSATRRWSWAAGPRDVGQHMLETER